MSSLELDKDPIKRSWDSVVEWIDKLKEEVGSGAAEDMLDHLLAHMNMCAGGSVDDGSEKDAPFTLTDGDALFGHLVFEEGMDPQDLYKMRSKVFFILGHLDYARFRSGK